ncbi:hypothetical protein FGK63_20350 [Ruegeria sediminis]|uniref:Uncharacterized protein n=1 Tax=Ruegeria sediminis TaxID=2583820 RepID=A0ABY2WS16_9RHOB|nr:hypothetical protein [Ruegeria sediminis]TMV02581.1 hypothetical protein FGK63_20350 [Ruegeria sediminis]
MTKFIMNGVGYSATMQPNTVFRDHQWLTFIREDGEEAGAFVEERNLKRGYADIKEAMLSLVQVFPSMSPKFVGEGVA